MDNRERAEKRIRAALQAPPPDPVPGTRRFFHAFFADASSTDEALEDVRSLAEQNPYAIVRGLVAMELLLDNPPLDGTVSELVAWDANVGLEDPSDAGALAWLATIATQVRGILGEEAPPRR